jgi:quinol monooxygenase YgiN
MARVALVVGFRLKPGSRAAFDAVMTEHASRTRAEEPGCRQFDILYPEGEPDRAVLIEVYDDQAAYEAHRAGPRMPKVNDALAPLTLERERTIGTLA